MFIWPILIVLLLFLLICIGILRFHAEQVQERKALLLEALWKRRHKIPLLLEVIGGQAELIELRNKVSSGAYTLPEEISMEKEMSQRLRQIFQDAENESSIKSDSLLLSIKKEFSDVTEEIRICINDYNYALQKFSSVMKWPWFMILSFAFKISKNRPLEAL